MKAKFIILILVIFFILLMRLNSVSRRSTIDFKSNYQGTEQRVIIDYSTSKIDVKKLDLKTSVLDYLASKGENIEIWDKIITGESNWRLDAKNPNSSARGLYQIIKGTGMSICGEGYLTNEFTQTDCAIKIKNVQGFTAWEVYKIYYGI